MFARQTVPLFRLLGNGDGEVQCSGFMFCHLLRPHLWYQIIPGETRVFAVLTLLVAKITDVDMPWQQGILNQLLKLRLPLHHLGQVDAVGQSAVGLPDRNAIVDA